MDYICTQTLFSFIVILLIFLCSSKFLITSSPLAMSLVNATKNTVIKLGQYQAHHHLPPPPWKVFSNKENQEASIFEDNALL